MRLHPPPEALAILSCALCAQLKHFRWTTAFEAKASQLKTLVLGVGSEWWRQYNYPSALQGCASPGGIADAHVPLTAVSNARNEDIHSALYRACDVMHDKYHAMAQNVAQYVASVSAFKGRVVVVTAPSGVHGCEGVQTPSGPLPSAAERTVPPERLDKASFWFHSNPQAHRYSVDPQGGGLHPYGQLRAAEGGWAAAFQKRARRLKLTVLNISVLSDPRADALVPGSACEHFCYPGLPHHWAEMLLRVLEQHVFGTTDGLRR